MSISLYHGAHTRFALHLGQCWTPSERSARTYAGRREIVACAELDLSDLSIYECEGYDRDEDDAPGDSPASLALWGIPEDADVIIYEDEDENGRAHTTYRLLSQRAIDALSDLNMTCSDA